jgi:hypothetical protein
VIEPSLSLAISIHSNPGVYALLIGSGVSRSSGVPTGWEIVADLICRLAKLKREDCGSDPHQWYRSTFGREPDYSEILNEVAKSSAERMQLLRSFFEPTEEERQEGRKLPTPAHRAIADLVVKGYMRVLITTNFDRLLESALVDVGIQPIVISTEDAAKGALPLAHSRCTLIKLNGDYLDSRLKNTADELSRYEQTIESLLDQVFDEYGLLTCGWSGDWDTALKGALERCPVRRFTMYWASRGDLSEKAQKLVALRQAAVIPITGADEFFRELVGNVSALEDMANTDSLSAKVAVARMKRYLGDPTQRISLHDLITAETEKANAVLTSSRFPVHKPTLSARDIVPLLTAYEAVADTILRLAICGAYWGEPQHDQLLLRCYKRIADQPTFQGTTTVMLARLKLYPALLLLYGLGIAALSYQNYRFLKSLFSLRVKYDGYKPEQMVVSVIHDQTVLSHDHQRQVLGNRHTPISDHLFEVLRDPLREYLPSDAQYGQMFDWFEYLLCLCHCDAEVSRSDLATKKAEKADFTLWASVGRFGWKPRYEGEPNIQTETELKQGDPYPEKVAAVLKAGLFESGGQHDDKYREVKAAFDRLVGLVRSQWIVFG